MPVQVKKKRGQKKTWVPRGYALRRISLTTMKFKSYQVYLNSLLWFILRTKVIERCGRVCEVCKNRRMTEVHHLDYSLPTMKGQRMDLLVGCCHECHEGAERVDGRKTSLREANRRLGFKIDRRTGKVKNTGKKCSVCGRNTPKRGEPTCTPCKSK